MNATDMSTEKSLMEIAMDMPTDESLIERRADRDTLWRLIARREPLVLLINLIGLLVLELRENKCSRDCLLLGYQGVRNLREKRGRFRLSWGVSCGARALYIVRRACTDLHRSMIVDV